MYQKNISSHQTSFLLLLLSKIFAFFCLFLLICSLAFIISYKIPQISLISQNFPSPSLYPTPYNLPPTTHLISFIHDGDTIYVKGVKEGIRLIGIDAPELAYSYTKCTNPNSPKCKTNECGALEAKQKLKNLIEGKKVYLIKDEAVGDRDKYSRLLRHVLLCPQSTTPHPLQPTTSSCSDISLILLQEGFVHEASFGTKYTLRNNYLQAQNEAKSQHIGIWGKCQ